MSIFYLHVTTTLSLLLWDVMLVLGSAYTKPWMVEVQILHRYMDVTYLEQRRSCCRGASICPPIPGESFHSCYRPLPTSM